MLSFIVPVYNKEAYLEKCLKSLAEQSLKDWELICVLDGPQAYANDIIRRVMNKVPNHYKIVEIEHGGACRARNEGFKHSKGDQVVFWDADCIIEPDAAKAWVDIFNDKPEVGFIYSSYKFLDEKGAITAKPFDPWLLRVRNFISGCFPVRRSLVGQWNEDLKSLQDWDFWLGVVDRGGVGKFMLGYAFSTAYPDEKSISGQGCGPDVWLERVDAVKKLHGLPERDVCVSAIDGEQDGIRLAKLIDADYQDVPNFKPHRYKTIIQIGFNMDPRQVEVHASIFNQAHIKKILFWTADNISQIYNGVSFSAISKYADLLNAGVTQYVEDLSAKRMMERAGFKVEVLPVPFEATGEIKPLPEKPRFAVDICAEYGHVFTALEKSLPDVEIEMLTGAHKIENYTGLLHFYLDRTMTSSIKRMVLAGRHVISNVQAPFAGYVNDLVAPDLFIPEMVDKIRSLVKKGNNADARDYFQSTLTKDKLLEAIKA